ncbi:MAG: DUF2147 domain-containing protein [Hyphomonadaceae bacterium]|nr:DUF2147 domain-containing protein [Hyphomonadaceae bacterium]
MNYIKSIVLSAAMLPFVCGTAFADDADNAIGTWLRPKQGWHVEFAMCVDNPDKLCGTVISGEGVDKKTQGSVVGVKMLFDLEKNKKKTKWKGKMYDPKGGGTYDGSVKVLDDGRVKMSGCMAKIMCRSEKWKRVEPEPVIEDAEAMPAVED